MLLLAVETSSDRGSLAVLDGERLEGEALFPEGLVHGREITVHLASLMAKLGLSPSRLEAIAVGVGPGSYTGIRVGVTAAKTLAFALRLPVLADSSLRVLAANAAGAAGEAPQEVVTAVDAKQRQVYVARFLVEPGQSGSSGAGGGKGVGSTVREEIGEHVLELAEGVGEKLSRLLLPGAVVLGDGSDALLEAGRREGLEKLIESVRRGPREWDWPRASVLGMRCAGPSPLHGARADGAPKLFAAAEVHNLTPVYLRASEAERKFAARSLFPPRVSGSGSVSAAPGGAAPGAALP